MNFASNPTFTYWVALGKKSVRENPMTRPSGTWVVDVNGVGSGTMQSTPVTWKVTAVGSGLHVKVNSAMYAPAVEMNLTAFDSRCYQGMG